MAVRNRPIAIVFGAAATCVAAGVATPLPAAGAAPTAGVVLTREDGDAAAVERLIATLSVREKAAQMVMPWVPGGVKPGSDAYRRAERLVVRHRVGGVIIGKGDRDATARTLRELQARASVPLLVASDLEWGSGGRLVGTTVLPAAMAVAATGDTALAYAHGFATAIEARAAGLHVAFAPVLDVNVNPRNPIINIRSFGEDPAAVARFGAATVRGLQDGGLIAVGKHFPGHGDTDLDSHLALPTIGVSRARLDTVELLPFRAAIRAGMAGIMVGHIAAPALGGGRTPATLSPAVTTTVLRREMGFGGLVVTDALNMAGVTRYSETSEMILRAVLAGADILLQPNDPEIAIDAITEAVARGQVSRARLDASVRRILRAKARAGLLGGGEPKTTSEGPPARAGSVSHLADSIAMRSITLLRDSRQLVPVRPPRSVVALTYVGSGAGGHAGAVFDSTLRAHGVSVQRRVLSPRTAAAIADSLLGAWSSGGPPLVILSSYGQPVPGQSMIEMPTAVAAAVEKIARRAPLIHIAFGSPYMTASAPSAGAVLLAWSGIPQMQRAAARAVLGGAAVGGRLPISLLSLPLGHGIDRAATVAIE